MTEHVIYALNDRYDPAVQYYSMPTSCVGGGPSIHAARASYVSAMADTIGVDKRALPQAIEHLETPVVGDIWVRTTLDDRKVERDRLEFLVREAMKVVDPVTRTELEQVTTAAGTSVMVLTLDDDVVGNVFDQMAIEDAVWMVVPRRNGIAWTALYRANAEGLRASENTELDTNEIRTMAVVDFIRDIVEPSNDGVDIEIDETGQAHRTIRSARPRPLVLVS